MTIAPPSRREPLLAVPGKPVRLPWTRGFWGVTAFLLAWLAVIGALEITPRTATALRFDGTFGWAFSDGERATSATAGEASLVTVPIRSGQVQGVYFSLFNASGLTQTVEGLAPNSVAPGGMQTWIEEAAAGGAPSPRTSSRQGSPVAIPPHESRTVGLFWFSNSCMSPGTTESMDSVRLQVKVGLIERDETIHFASSFGVTGPSDPLPSEHNALCG